MGSKAAPRTGRKSKIKTVMVTGAAGYIGCMLTIDLVHAGYNVIALDRFFFGKQSLANVEACENLHILKEDVRHITAKQLEGVDAVIDMAALSNDPSGELQPDLTRSINFEARARLAKLAKKQGVQRYVLASSCSVYGGSTTRNLSEDSEPRPLTTYAQCNVLAEEALLKLNDEKFSVAIMRNGTVFGLSHRMRFDLVINLMTLHAFSKGKITIMGGGSQIRPLIHVRDVARAAFELMTAPSSRVSGKTFNIVGDNHSIRSLAYLVREQIPFFVSVVDAPDDADKRDYHVSGAKIAKSIGYTPQLTVADGVREVYQALRDGTVADTTRTRTVNWYQYLLDAQQIIDDTLLDGRLLA